jgi:hypothetical protein
MSVRVEGPVLISNDIHDVAEPHRIRFNSAEMVLQGGTAKTVGFRASTNWKKRRLCGL